MNVLKLFYLKILYLYGQLFPQTFQIVTAERALCPISRSSAATDSLTHRSHRPIALLHF